MKTAVVLSDTHGNRAAIDALYGVLSESDYIFHLGDTSSDCGYIRQRLPHKRIISINGNCDMWNLGEDESVTEIEGVKIFACHGHRYSAKHTLLKLALRGKELGCDVVLYGHTHCAREDEYDGVKLINPGCMTRYSRNSYAYLVINGENTVCKIVYTG